MNVAKIDDARRAKKRSQRKDVLPEYHYTACGLDNVYLENVQYVVRGGEPRVLLKSLPTLLRVISACFAYKPAGLLGNEVRFIRSVLGYAAKDFADLLSLRPETLSRMENGHEPVSVRTDKLIRLKIALDLIRHKEIAPFFDLKRLERLIETDLAAEEGDLALYLRYTGPYVEASHEQLEFKFRKAA